MNTELYTADLEETFRACADDIVVMYERCCAHAPDFKVTREQFMAAIETAARKYLASCFNTNSHVKHKLRIAGPCEELQKFLNALQADDLFLALACAQGCETAWRQFDTEQRGYIWSTARHLSGSASRAEEIVGFVYAELYGTRVINGVRQSKFVSYSGRGTLRGWLRAVIWHSIVDMHRASHDEVSLEDWSEAGGESDERPGKRGVSATGASDEHRMMDELAEARYRAAVEAALATAFGALSDHEKLLLMMYHIENIKLREIARCVEDVHSPLRDWFQRQPKWRANGGASTPRVHESTVLRWLGKVYERVRENFCVELTKRYGMGAEEVNECLKLAANSHVYDMR
ncbi:MAG: hypothetical protein NVSMB56_09200 [Pyrinomonadaceae bacterium]